MNDIAIHAENLGKLYRLGQFVNYDTLREAIMDAAAAPFRRLRSANAGHSWQKTDSEHVWALKDVSFEVKQGEVLGIIGRNGAGKTTLLKVLARITTPTEGFAEIRGRVGSLLEVGTGFHSELSGRENIYLYGAVLGMKRGEIDSKYDEIVDFSEVEKFIDTPLKRYSSGMKVRLAFAVAAHLEPEILLVDEVLAVGDAAFQKKCLGKMGNVAERGRTILFVSHNMVAVAGLCDRAILLDGGRISEDGATQSVIEKYLVTGIEEAAEVCWPFDTAPGGEKVRLRAVRVRNHQGEVSVIHQLSKPVTLEMEFWCLKDDIRINPLFYIANSLGVYAFTTGNIHDPQWGPLYKKGLYQAWCTIPGNLLNDGQYRVTATVAQENRYVVARQKEAVSFEMHDDGLMRGDYVGSVVGIVRPILPWSVERIGEI